MVYIKSVPASPLGTELSQQPLQCVSSCTQTYDGPWDFPESRISGSCFPILLGSCEKPSLICRPSEKSIAFSTSSLCACFNCLFLHHLCQAVRCQNVKLMMLLYVKGKGYEAIFSQCTPFLSSETFYIPKMFLNLLMKVILHNRCQTSASELCMQFKGCAL